MHADIRYHIGLLLHLVLYSRRVRLISEQFFVVDYLVRNPNDRVLINQIPNVWIIQNVKDEDAVIGDISQTDFLICFVINQMPNSTIF